MVFLLLYISEAATPSRTGLLQVTFLDVGQGDAIFIETPDGVQVLIDGGPDSSVLQGLASEMSFFDRTIDIVVGTHQDLDHIAGLIDILAQYDVVTILRTEGEGASSAAVQFVSSVADEGAKVVYARAGQEFKLGASTTMTVLSPSSETTNWGSNTGSVVVLLQYGDIGFMLTGDAPEGIETYLASTYGAGLEAEVLKLGHHGSKTSSAAAFLAVIEPQFAVVSAGRNNRYGHPHPEVLERAAATGAKVVSTQDGNIHFYTDGTRVWME